MTRAASDAAGKMLTEFCRSFIQVMDDEYKAQLEKEGRLVKGAELK